MALPQQVPSWTPTQYREEVAKKAAHIPAFQLLDDFLNQPLRPAGASPTKITIVHFHDDRQPDFQRDVDQEKLQNHIQESTSTRLFIVENVGPDTIARLGGHFAVEPQFFLDHLDNANWFRSGDIEKHLPPLKSVQLASRFIRFRFISPRELLLNVPGSLASDRIESDFLSTRVPRVAGGFNPTERLGAVFAPIALPRRYISVWFDSSKDKSGWNTGIVLLDPPFRPQKTLGRCQNRSYRAFVPNTDFDTSYQTSFTNCLEQDDTLMNGGIPAPFVILRDLYRIIASEWVVVNTCFERELNTIEWCLEKEQPQLERLDKFLNGLFIIRRRLTLYDIFVQEQLSSCSIHGRKYWDRSSSPGETASVGAVIETLEADFKFVNDLVQRNRERITKNISLLTALIFVEESRVGITNGKKLEALTVAATIFLPFSVVSSVMNINGQFGPGQPKQWVFWSISIPFSLILLTLYMLFGRSRSRRPHT
ncbi:hypothetical protein K432DRAFT_429215 [Lepidopterella palustris CBS 459.81]|uniref:Cora-domain-containing protein n=1 Tax=Lepidopterella palustris CBS 459.81 TaxID=1314670 RepID=A0A8E2E1Q7_9PEZI|nr:hypothetical protein K432DRAFT_429215 [Lepidopterella palustris CBS 459.81]